MAFFAQKNLDKTKQTAISNVIRDFFGVRRFFSVNRFFSFGMMSMQGVVSCV